MNHLRFLGVSAPIFPAAAMLTVDQELRQAQQALANDSLNIFQGPNTDLLGLEY
jgi:hypothetical protein